MPPVVLLIASIFPWIQTFLAVSHSLPAFLVSFRKVDGLYIFLPISYTQTYIHHLSPLVFSENFRRNSNNRKNDDYLDIFMIGEKSKSAK